MRIIQSVQAPEYDLRGVNIDLTRKTGVLIRQSRKGADLDSRESRLKQESLVPTAVQLRGDADTSNIILYDEGSGVSGTKGYSERPHLSRLYLDIANGVIGSIIVARADRLFRDKHQTYVSMFTQIAEQKHIILIVPGKAVYDFTKWQDLKAFRAEMEAAYNYIATHVAYMHDTHRQKVQRGLYGGGNLPAPYAIDRNMWKDKQVPVIYKPWQPIAVSLFERLRNYDYVLARMVRYIEEQSYLFPYPSPDDLQQYMFKTRMRAVTGGYTFSSPYSIQYYFSNLTLGGYAKVGRDDDGEMVYLASAHEPAIPMELLSDSIAAITGRYPDGTPFREKKFRSHAVSAMQSPAILHGMLQSDDGAVSFSAHRQKTRPVYSCYKGDGWTNKIGIMRQQTLWSVACEDLDIIVIKRLCDLASYDVDMSDRIKESWERRKSDAVDETALLKTQLEKVDATIRRLDKLLTDPAVPLTVDSERRYLEILREAEADRKQLLVRQEERRRDPIEIIPNFYTVLAHLPTEYKKLTPEGQKRMARQVIQDIKLNKLSHHLFLLQVKWQTGIAICPDVALVWRGALPNTSEGWTEEDDDKMRLLYPKATQLELMQTFPNRPWDRIRNRGSFLRIRRPTRHAGPHPFNAYHRTISYDDVEAATRLVAGEEDRLRDVVSTLARQTVRGGLSAHWWLPLDSVSYANFTGSEGLSLRGSVLTEWRHPV